MPFFFLRKLICHVPSSFFDIESALFFSFLILSLLQSSPNPKDWILIFSRTGIGNRTGGKLIVGWKSLNFVAYPLIDRFEAFKLSNRMIFFTEQNISRFKTELRLDSWPIKSRTQSDSRYSIVFELRQAPSQAQ